MRFPTDHRDSADLLSKLSGIHNSVVSIGQFFVVLVLFPPVEYIPTGMGKPQMSSVVRTVEWVPLMKIVGAL